MISIVLSSYNGEEYIVEQLESLVNQTYKKFELIIVDDCSTDSTIVNVEPYVKKYENIFLHKGKQNLGYVKNFERGVKLAKGEYIAFCDQDDFWLPNKLEVLMQNIGDYDVAYCDSQLVNNQLEYLGSNMSTGHNYITSKKPLNFLIKNCVSGHAMLFNRTLLKDDFVFPQLIPHDWWITFLASCNNGVVFVDQALVKYRIHDSNQIGGDGHKKISKENKNEQRKYRVQKFSEYVLKYDKKDKNTIRKLSESYESNSITNRFKRVFVFTTNVNAIFKISGRSILKKYFYAFSMFFKIR